jgi:dTDP-4-dehydrorhamnose 3,5-epimerase-like enzyme
VKKTELINFDTKGDQNGSLVAISGNLEIPFAIQRVFYIYGSGETVSRGNHANKKTEHVLIPVAGECEIVVDDGKEQASYHMQSPCCGLYVGSMIWKEMKNFSKDCFLLVLASTKYDSTEYSGL